MDPNTSIISFAPLWHAIQVLIIQLAELLGLINLKIAITGLTATEIAKKLIPDSIESKWIMLVGVVVCGLVSLIPKFNSDIQVGIITGCFIVGGYAFLFKFMKALFEGLQSLMKMKNGNGTTTSTPPSVPK
jgi:hypothetical protein